MRSTSFCPPPRIGGFLCLSLLLSQNLDNFAFCSAACGPELAWCTDGPEGILWVPTLLCAASPGCPLCAISHHCAPRLSPSPFTGQCALHAALSCPYSTISPSRGHSGGFQASTLCTAWCTSCLSPFLIVSSGPPPEVEQRAPATLVPVRNKKGDVGPVCTSWSRGQVYGFTG